MQDPLPYLTEGTPGVPLAARVELEDFFVEELPAYEPCGSGDHVYFGIEKRGLSTHEVIRRLAVLFETSPRQIGCAGLKDARGVTRQTLSLEHADPERIAAAELAGVRVLWVERHTNKLRRGHLHGNRFVLRLRDPHEQGEQNGQNEQGGQGGQGAAGGLLEREAQLRSVLAEIERRGLPNYFGPQRFGIRGDNWRVGKALLEGDAREAAAWIAGRPLPGDPPQLRKARELFDQGDYAEAARAWPGNFRGAVRLARAMHRQRGRAGRALRAVSGDDLRFCVSAFQSHLFNKVVARRLADGSLERLLPGDLAWRHVGGAVFRVDDPERESERLREQQISPSGPLFGHRMTRPEGEPDRIEQAVLAAEGVAFEAFQQRGRYQWKGARRPLRVPVSPLELRPGEDGRGPYLELGFALPSGSYATAVLRELSKA